MRSWEFESLFLHREPEVQRIEDSVTPLKCEMCGENHPACLDFHHKDKKDKSFNVAIMASSGYSIEKIKEEIAKCIVLCSNCHRKEHYKINNN